jgi:Tol biopolymer transport system component
VAILTAGITTAMLLPSPALATFPGGNGKIVFDDAASEFDPTWQLFTINPDGSDLTPVPGANSAYDAVWSPDGTKLAFTGCGDACFRGNEPGRAGLWDPPCSDPSCSLSDFFPYTTVLTMNADGSGLAPVMTGAADPAWSPDGTKLAFMREDDDIWTVNLDGSGLQEVTHDHAWQFQNCSSLCMVNHEPAWSLDGQKIAYTRRGVLPDGEGGWASTQGDIWVADANGTGHVNLTNSSDEWDRSASWSPFGNKIAFSSDRFTPTGGREQGLWTMNPDGSDESRIGSISFVFTPIWSPDGGTKFAFSNLEQILTVNANGTGLAQITNSPSRYAGAPDWQPLRRYPRPGGASPLRVPLVPAYVQCTTATQNSNHVAPLALDSCAPPVQQSTLLTTSTQGEGNGHVRLAVLPGAPSTFADEADVAIAARATDVVCVAVVFAGCSAPGEDYTGPLLLRLGIRLTDQASTIGAGAASATVEDTAFSAPVSCSVTADPPDVGSSCALSVTADTLVPGFAKEGRRAVMSMLSIALQDPGTDGSLGAGCPPACGTGDESAFLTQGLFTP